MDSCVLCASLPGVDVTSVSWNLLESTLLTVSWQETLQSHSVLPIKTGSSSLPQAVDITVFACYSTWSPMVNSCLCLPIYEFGDISHISPLNQIILIHLAYGKFFPLSVN